MRRTCSWKTEWITPELSSVLQQNPILSAGLRDPRCIAAIEVMQKDPKEAMKRFQNDPVVTLFLQEFGRVMSAHFEQLAKQQAQQQQSSSPTAVSEKIIEEVGPLQAKALQKQKQADAKAKPVTDEDEQRRVQQVRSILIWPFVVNRILPNASSTDIRRSGIALIVDGCRVSTYFGRVWRPS
jgi:hypothetical protein